MPQDPKFASLCGDWQTYLAKYQDLARELKICIVPGTIVELHRDAADEDDRLINVAYFIGSEGQVLGRYEKKNLWVGRNRLYFQHFQCIQCLRSLLVRF